MATTNRLNSLNPYAVAQLGGVELVARRVVDGYLDGVPWALPPGPRHRGIDSAWAEPARWSPRGESC